MLNSQFPPGTPVCVTQLIALRGQDINTEIVGVIEAWEELPTGSWYAHAPDGKLPLMRLRLKKADGEQVLLVIDDSTEIAKLEGK